jgi:hypothetical protein
MPRTIEPEHRVEAVSGKVAKIIKESILQNEEPQRPATARPSLLSAGPGQGETLNILSELDGKTGQAPRSGSAVRPGRKGLVAGTVLALVAMGGTAALVLGDVNTTAQVAQVSQVAPGLERGAVETGLAGGAPALGAAPSGGDRVAPAGLEADQPQRAGEGAGASGAANAALVAAPAVALAAALAAPAVDKPSTAATIIDTPQAVAEPAPVRKAVAKTRKAAPAKERRTRVAKAKTSEQKVAKVKTHRKPAAAPRQPQATPDSDVDLLAALVAHTRPQQGARVAPCPPADDKTAAVSCNAGHKQ